MYAETELTMELVNEKLQRVRRLATKAKDKADRRNRLQLNGDATETENDTDTGTQTRRRLDRANRTAARLQLRAFLTGGDRE